MTDDVQRQNMTKY